MALHTKWSSGDLIFYDGTQDIFRIKNSTGGMIVGESDEGVDFKFFGDTTGAYALWDESADAMKFVGADVILGDTDYVKFGNAPDITMAWDESQFVILPAAANSDMHFGSTGKPLDVVNYGNITYRDPQAQDTTGLDTVTLTSTSNRIQFLDSTGNFIVVVPTSSGAGIAGMEFKIFNKSTGTISVKEGTSGGSAVASITKGEGAILISDNTEWKAILGTT